MKIALIIIVVMAVEAVIAFINYKVKSNKDGKNKK